MVLAHLVRPGVREESQRSAEQKLIQLGNRTRNCIVVFRGDSTLIVLAPLVLFDKHVEQLCQ